jgi:hypothetical protein
MKKIGAFETQGDEKKKIVFAASPGHAGRNAAFWQG